MSQNCNEKANKQRYRSLWVVVTTFEADDTVYSEKSVDLHSFNANVWLFRHTKWAALNKKTVEITHKEDTAAR